MISGNDRIFVFDLANPFPFIVGTPPIRGDLYCYDLDRQYSKDVHIPTEKLFSTVTLALVPRFPLEYKDRDALWEIYGERLIPERPAATRRGDGARWMV